MKYSRGQTPLHMFLHAPRTPGSLEQGVETSLPAQQHNEGQLGQHVSCTDGTTEGNEQQQKQQGGDWRYEQQQEQQQTGGGQRHTPAESLQQQQQQPPSAPDLGDGKGSSQHQSSLPGQVASLRAWLPDPADHLGAAAAAAAAAVQDTAAGAGSNGAGKQQEVGSSSSMRTSVAASVDSPASSSAVTRPQAAAALRQEATGSVGGDVASVAQGVACAERAVASGGSGQGTGGGALVGWANLTPADIDPAVLAELPFHVQQEVMQAMRGRGQAGAKRGGRAAVTERGSADRQSGNKGNRQNGRGRGEVQDGRNSSSRAGSISRFFHKSSS